MTTWIAEALGVIGPSASPLAVAKSIWAQHEQEIRASGDLLYTWQLDLQTAAAAMISAGTLALADGEWSLTDTTPPPPARRRTWDDDEITVIVEGYLALLQAEHGGSSVRRRDVVTDLVAQTNRSLEQVEGLLANVSQVVQELGFVPLSSYPPKSNVPAGVRPVVRTALGSLR
ncbi:hypothetical protein BJ980_002707 [Nocardioides daedukensis]|uniref:Uncharacterized protein n=1 Tax=Nocardioides daedukensis TaxID=634462 RepID=A0A7Y9S4V8_9ACTN|nr:hypothetical protein [Nocardioides daedukensis]NYG59784.1 hypothetical protein [Nocardioides daedukensis]